MLTIHHPEIIPLVNDFPVGLLALSLNEEELPKLIIKTSKEMILAAKLNQEFKLYAVPVCVQNQSTICLVTAFFDDEDEPLVIFSPIFDEYDSRKLKETLLRNTLDVYFFDENCRELLGYNAQLECNSRTLKLLEQTNLLPFDQSSVRLILNQAVEWFGHRNAQDDLSAVSVQFSAALFPEDLVIQDLIPQKHAYHGSKPFSYTQLIREEPGYFQERDIVQLLHRFFLPEQIYLGPLRTNDKKEIVDVLVVTDVNVLFIQAKDSPNTENITRKPIDRKKATTKKSLNKAVKQMRGTLRYARSNIPMRMISGDKEIEVALEGRIIRTLIIVKELFNDEYSVYSPILLSLAEEIQAPCIALDYMELHMYTKHLSSEDSFFTAYDRVFAYGIHNGAFPRLRLHPAGD